MHVPDGFINAPVSLAAGAVAAAAVAVSLRGARRELDERTAPLAGLVAAFVFAVQMLNFPVAAGTSGHLLGGALAAILVGPYTGVLCISVVLLMQGVLFADGGLTALGVNITDMAVATTAVAYALFRLLLTVLPRRRSSVTAASFVAALVSVPAAAVVFTALYALGGTTDIAIGKVFTAMVGVHALIGIGEAAITALTVGAVLAVRPDLVHGARGLAARLEIRTAGAGASPAGTASPAGSGSGSGSSADTHAGRGAVAESDAAAGTDASARMGAGTGSEPVAGTGAAARTGAGAASRPAADARTGVGAGQPSGPGPGQTPGAGRPPASRPAAGPAADARTGASAGTGAGTGAPPAPVADAAPAPVRSTRRVKLVGLVAALALAGFGSYYASASPDGLEKVAHDKGIDRKTEDHAAKDSPLADYQVKDVSNVRLAGGLAGVIGVGATLVVGTGVAWTVHRRRTRSTAAEARERGAA
ncbi:energy-coupling factor ABC transporter permease [Streptomyces varsoviensis]|uniref:energy-coupling factor ABC transporter permease n=1 Tax=Streptomyces varsoviensis TaxID=67373 RepID=UPI0004C68221|nr:energy-coupling factor ABC transporter permease [Streptomyces varsoviensis]